MTLKNADESKYIETRGNKLSLEFRCVDTPERQRKLCQAFWNIMNQHPEFDLIMAKGWTDKPDSESSKTSTPSEPDPCGQLNQLLTSGIDTLALATTRRDELPPSCRCLPRPEPSGRIDQWEDDLDLFDSELVTEHCAPPRIRRNNQDNKTRPSRSSYS